MIRKMLDNNPFVALAGVVVATASLTSAILGFFWSQEVAMLESKHEYAVSQLQAEINSIERGISVDLPREFNVRIAMISDTQALRLDKNFSSFSDGSYYVDTPDRGSWTHTSTDEVSAGTFVLDDECQQTAVVRLDLEGRLRTGTVEIWHLKSDDSIRLSIAKQSPLRSLCEHLRLFSSVKAQVVDQEWVRRNTRFFTFFPPDDATAEELSEFAVDPKSAFEDLVKQDVDLAGYLAGDLAGPLLVQILAQDMMMIPSIFPGASGRVLEVEKAQNALYVHSQITIPVSGEDSENSEVVSFEREIFIIGSGSQALLVEISLVHSDRERFPDKYAWTQGWLAGLRIVAPAL
jgi:hypothetical protein